MPKAVIWDVGNVVVRWNPRTLYSKIFPEPVACDRFLASVCTMAWHLSHDLGISFADNRAPLVAQYPEFRAEIEAWESRWWEMFSGTIPETEAAIEALHAVGVPQYGLTNMSDETYAGTMAMSPAFAYLRDIVVSGREGLIKPDPAIYALTCQRFGLAPQDILFIDDSLANVESARAFGIDGHHFTDPSELWPALAARGLL